MPASDLTVTLGDTTLRLTCSASGRFRTRTDGPSGPAYSCSFGPEALLQSAEALDDGILITYRPHPGATLPGHGELVVHARMTLGSPGSPGGEIIIGLSAPDDFPLEELTGPLVVPEPDGSRRDEWQYLLPDGEGLWTNADGTGPGARARLVFHQHRISLPMTALVDSAGAAVMVTGVGGNDHAVDLVVGATPDTLSGMRLVNFSSLGTWHHAREWIVTTVPRGGAEALSRIVADQLRDSGLELASQSEKMTARGVPTRLHRSVGGTLLWCHFDTLTAGIVEDLQQAGLSSVMVMGRPADEEAAEALRASRYAGGPYFQTYDVFPPGSVEELGWRGVYPPEGAMTGWPEDLIHGMEGWLNDGWRYLPFAPGDRFWDTERYLDAEGRVAQRSRALHTYTTVQTFRRCPSRHKHVVEEKGLPVLAELQATAVFYDIATAMYALECYAPDHPVHRIEDIRYRLEILELLGEGGRLVHSEAGKWWAIDTVNTFEGLFSYDWEFNIGSIQLEDYPLDRGRRAFELNLEHRVPFFGMVARHAVARTAWWGTGQDRHAQTWASHNALTALFGANPLYVVDPDHPLRPGTPRWQPFVESSRSFDVLNDVARDACIVSYETDGPDVGRTVFATGASVEANVGDHPHGGLEAGEYVVRDGTGKTVAHVLPA